MSIERNEAIVGVFASLADARRAIEDLRDAGFSDRKIGVLTHDEAGDPEVTSFRDLKGNKAGAGAAIGGAAGAGGGALWALAIAAGVLPAIGPVIAGGLLVAVAASAAGGAAAGVVIGTLVGLGIRDEDAAYYDAEFRKGRTILVVQPDERARLVETVLAGNRAQEGRFVRSATFAEQVEHRQSPSS